MMTQSTLRRTYALRSLALGLTALFVWASPAHAQLDPMLAAAAMSASSVAVMANALRLRNVAL